MYLTFGKRKQFNEVFKDSRIDLKHVTSIDPWGMARICLAAIELSEDRERQIIYPEKEESLNYLERIHFDRFLRNIGFENQAKDLEEFTLPGKKSPQVQEIVYSKTRDEFEARLPRYKDIFVDSGLNLANAQIATAVIGELGNNVFDHNLGSWPTNIPGAVMVGQRLPRLKEIDMVVADPGVGFRESLRLRKPSPKDEIEAIKLGLKGVTGWIGRDRGNGLRIVQKWTLDNFSGILRIQSGDGLVIVDQDGIKSEKVDRILGTIVEVVIKYK